MTVVNVTDEYGCLGIAGPHSRDVMASLTSTPVGNKDFPFLSFQNLSLKGIPVLAVRVSYTGMYADESYRGLNGERCWCR